MKILVSTFLLFISQCAFSHAGEKQLTIADLNTGVKIIGELGVPLHTVHEVKCEVVDMTFTRAKADDGRLALLILEVDGKVCEEKRYIDLPTVPGGMKAKPKDRYHFWAYETLVASGYPTEAFRKLEQPQFATVDIHFRSELVVLKWIAPEKNR